MELFIMRRKKKITLKELAEYIGCSISLLSLFENEKVDMDAIKRQKYRQYIINK